ncbi:MAG TPA: hypothetical protein VJG32_13750 [Anaerolineae bacterium]|nr:hypothetical protein [Anaerolineae bacterium]
MILLQNALSETLSLSRLATSWLDGERRAICLNEARPRPGVGDLVIQAGPRYEAARIAALVGDREVGEALDATTDHAWLVVLGEYARHLGLLERLAEVPLEQRTREYTPQTKLIQSLVGVLAGLEYLQDFNDGPQPLVQDAAVIASWGQPAFAHYSGVSRTLEAADAQTLQAVSEVLQTLSQPFIDAEVMALVQGGRPLELDIDLTGRRVSPTSTTYPDADFGWMDNALHNGYQAALTSLSGGPCGRLLLSSQRYPGRAQSAGCLQAAAREAEQVLGVRPRRRTELVQARLDKLSAQTQPLQTRLEQQQTQRHDLFAALQTARADAVKAQAEVTRLSAEWTAQGRQERPHSHLAKARWQVESAQKRQGRVGRGLRRNAGCLTKLEAELMGLLAQHAQLTEWLAELEGDNVTLLNPLTLVLRVDAGFSTDDTRSVTWLIEMGYVVYTKVHNGKTTDKLRRHWAATTPWQRVGRNAEAVYLPHQAVAECPYALDALLVRYHRPAGELYTTLLYYGETPPPQDLRAWFTRYNARQTLEAGIKEGKGVFPMRRPWVRSPFGLQLQEQFSRFAANFVRWAARWAQHIVRQANRLMTDALTEVKTLVRVLTRCRARLVVNTLGRVILLDEQGPFAGSMFLLAGQVAFQHVLPLFSRSSFRPHATT